MKTSDFLKVIQENYTPDRTMFLCCLAHDVGASRNEDPDLWKERMQSILQSHNIQLSGNWHRGMPDADDGGRADFHRFIRHLFLTLAIRQFQNLGD